MSHTTPASSLVDDSVQVPPQEATAQNPNQQIDSLTGLRFYAAFSVFLSHLYHFNYMGFDNPYFLTIMSGLGPLGVSLFYVLSGFVLFARYRDERGKKLNLLSFFTARLARIYPVFLFTTILAIPIELFSERAPHFWSNLFQVATLTHCYTQEACSSFNDVGWSIGVESFFYLMFPLFLLAFTRPRNILLLFFGVLVYVLLIHFFFPHSLYAGDRFPVNRSVEFLAGMSMGWLFYNVTALGTLFHKEVVQKIAPFMLILLALSLIAMPLLLKPLGLASMSYLFYLIPATLLIFTLAGLEEKATWRIRGLTSKLIVFGGESSYSFYLIHNLLFRYMRHGLALVLHISTGTASLPIQIALALTGGAASLLSAAAMYLFIEKPCRVKIRNWVTAWQKKAPNKQAAS